MVKKALITAAAAAFIFSGIASLSYAADAGPAEITLVTANSQKPKPAVFPHKAHQDRMQCAECHHGMADGKQVPYTEGQEIGKCESCHNSEKLAGKLAGKEKLDTFKGAAHTNCLGCHKEVAAKDEAKKELKSCKTCHKS
jgi:nitrate/TMAO reductase-like tetraheme cytochrome c subunit